MQAAQLVISDLKWENDSNLLLFYAAARLVLQLKIYEWMTRAMTVCVLLTSSEMLAPCCEFAVAEVISEAVAPHARRSARNVPSCVQEPSACSILRSVSMALLTATVKLSVASKLLPSVVGYRRF